MTDKHTGFIQDPWVMLYWAYSSFTMKSLHSCALFGFRAKHPWGQSSFYNFIRRVWMSFPKSIGICKQERFWVRKQLGHCLSTNQIVHPKEEQMFFSVAWHHLPFQLGKKHQAGHLWMCSRSIVSWCIHLGPHNAWFRSSAGPGCEAMGSLLFLTFSQTDSQGFICKSDSCLEPSIILHW